MFNHVLEAITYIESQRNRRSLDDFKKTVHNLGVSLSQKNIIHIAGTNGKGSTVNFLREIFMNHGLRVGTFTSPYITVHNDRIRINNHPIEDELLLKYINELYPTIEKDGLSMFEIDVLIMLRYFDDEELDVRIIETGIGGKDDKTNVVDSYISAITQVGLDHQMQLGTTREDIALNKCGIIKAHQHFFTTEQSPHILSLMEEYCMFMQATFHHNQSIEHLNDHTFVYRGVTCHLNSLPKYQINNIALAIDIAMSLIDVDVDIVSKSVSGLIWEGRYEKFTLNDQDIILDGAHNIPAIEALLMSLPHDKHIGIIFSVLSDKDYKDMYDLINESNYDLILTSFEDERVTDLSELGHLGECYPHFRDALSACSNRYDLLVFTGSLHFISQVRQYIREKQ